MKNQLYWCPLWETYLWGEQVPQLQSNLLFVCLGGCRIQVHMGRYWCFWVQVRWSDLRSLQPQEQSIRFPVSEFLVDGNPKVYYFILADDGCPPRIWACIYKDFLCLRKDIVSNLRFFCQLRSCLNLCSQTGSAETRLRLV